MIYRSRQARTSFDFDEIERLHCLAFIGGKKEIPDFTGAWFLISSGGENIAFAGIHLSRNYQNTAYLCRVAVLPEHQRRGLHKRLIRIRERWARRNDIDWVVTDTRSDNYPSVNSLIGCGYKLWRPPNRIAWAEYSNPLYWYKKI